MADAQKILIADDAKDIREVLRSFPPLPIWGRFNNALTLSSNSVQEKGLVR